MSERLQSPAPAGTAASMRIRPRSDGSVVYDVRFRLDGRSKSLSFSDPKKAQRWMSLVRSIGVTAALALMREQDSGSVPTLDEWAETYIGSLSGIEGKTIDDYRLYMRVSISPTLGALPVDVITPARIAGWVNEQATRYAAKTVHNRHGFLFAALAAAVEAGHIARNPCAKTRLPRSERQEMVFLSPNEYRQLLGYIPARHRTLVQLLAGTGMRWGEASALRPEDFDLTAGTVRVSRAWKSSADRGWYIGPPKTARSRRTISLPRTMLPELTALVTPGAEWVFVNEVGGGPIRHAKFWSNVWAPARRLANGMPAHPLPRTPAPGSTWDVEPAARPIGKWPRIHDLRHTHASWLIADGIALPVVQRRLGHESITTTIDLYTHLSPDMLLEPAAAMDSRLAIEEAAR